MRYPFTAAASSNISGVPVVCVSDERLRPTSEEHHDEESQHVVHGMHRDTGFQSAGPPGRKPGSQPRDRRWCPEPMGQG